ncbi:hypothetical protein [Geodermatophilus sabuli]|uniref:Uncharacterized protein n=1 Tax=Geodermatophilus sabuli TaxID=1564158 RepID=A0A285E8Z9_9ACTN|nr:hypothetical protein [Geodermatophilus sabuli]MBB3085105.1 hypothetical protein [Geodermatophilus sabuli]SNX95487.1 hypothetical protein SAMN06893097_102186 [Geodermatophilus sabuli]
MRLLATPQPGVRLPPALRFAVERGSNETVPPATPRRSARPGGPPPRGGGPAAQPPELRRFLLRSTAQMTTALALSANTVRGHVRTLQRTLAAPDRDGLVGRARGLGLL